MDSIGDLSGLLNQPTGGNGGPLELPIDLIDEDPNQPRHEDSPGFSKQSLGELAETIRERKVKSPIPHRSPISWFQHFGHRDVAKIAR
ncbi:hypothetical protein [Thiolapillus sp.]|uniref:hypothetical protein n=1 Tax=Thiolapillus sp. TaxID=2017437 RepID=UPI00273856A9